VNQNPDYDKYPVLLVSPPLHDFYFTPARIEPLGLLYLAEALRREGFEKVDVLDAASAGKTKRMARPPEMDYLSAYYHEDESCFSLLHTWQRRGISDTAIVRAIKEGEYRLVGISAMFSAYVLTLSIVRRIRQSVKGSFLLRADGLLKQNRGARLKSLPWTR
jgi:hypothetical protein